MEPRVPPKENADIPKNKNVKIKIRANIMIISVDISVVFEIPKYSNDIETFFCYKYRKA